MPERMMSAIEGLDRILDGGFLYHNAVLLKGEPGSGKTTLGIQIIFNGAVKYNEPGIIVLFEQFPQQMLRDMRSYGWDLEELAKEKKIAVIFAQAEDVVKNRQVSEAPLMSKIHDAAIAIGAKRILIDSLSHFIHTVREDMHERELLFKLINAVKSIGLTPFFTSEKENDDTKSGFDEYMTDCVIHLSSQAVKDKTFPMRLLDIRKTRGHNHVRGLHPYKITNAGIEVYPHILPEKTDETSGTKVKLEKVNTGIQGLDELLFGGYTRGTANIIAGMPGTFKTTLAAQYLAKCAENNEKCKLITFNEEPNFLVSVMKQKGISLDEYIDNGTLHITKLSPKNFYMDELLYNLEKDIAAKGIKHIVVDGINDLERNIEDPDTYEDYISWFISLLHEHNVTSLFTQKLSKFTTSSPLSDIKYAEMFDGIVYIGAVEIESAVMNVISILKMRGSAFSTDLRKLTCTTDRGLVVKDKFIGMSGILAGNPRGQYKKTVEEIFQPLYFVRDFLDMVGGPDIDNEQRASVLGSVKGEMLKLVDKLKEYFDEKGK